MEAPGTHCFAGRECGVSLAKMSFEETHLDLLEGFSTVLNYGEKCEPYSWFESLENFNVIQLWEDSFCARASLHPLDSISSKLTTSSTF